MCMCRAYTVGFIFKGNVTFHRRNEENNLRKLRLPLERINDICSKINTHSTVWKMLWHKVHCYLLILLHTE